LDVAVRDLVTRIPVRTPEGRYEIALGRGLLQRVGEFAQQAGLGRKVVVASDSNVLPLYGEPVLASLREHGFEASAVAMSAGETHKQMGSVDLFVEAFLDSGLDRSGWVLTLGGGVVGDTAGFAASIYMRGVPLVQAPTTLLSMADSSVGGKVGVDHPRGKNLLGSFKQPALVVADLDTLSSLPPEQVAAGMAEVIKAGIIADPALFESIEKNSPEMLELEQAIEAAIAVKLDIVERDPYESGERALLNLGHTFGHAFEKASGYGRLHGFAVAQGMADAFRLAVRLGICPPEQEARVVSVLEKWQLPTRWGGTDLSGPGAVEQVWAAMASDKKRREGKMRFILPEAIGSVRIVEGIEEADVKRVLGELQ
jgi:3-dehydroquinate synthase